MCRQNWVRVRWVRHRESVCRQNWVRVRWVRHRESVCRQNWVREELARDKGEGVKIELGTSGVGQRQSRDGVGIDLGRCVGGGGEERGERGRS